MIILASFFIDPKAFIIDFGRSQFDCDDEKLVEELILFEKWLAIQDVECHGVDSSSTANGN